MSDDKQPEEAQEAQVVAVQDNQTGLPPMLSPDFDADMAIEAAAKRADLMKAVRLASLNTLQRSDFIDAGGKPYLQNVGCDRLKPLWGITRLEVKIEPSIKEIRECIEKKKPVTVEASGIYFCASTGERGAFIGTRSSDSKFYEEQLKKNGRIDPGDLRKAAFSNLEVNAVTRLLGLRGLDWEDVETYTGMDASQAGGAFKYKNKDKKGQQQGGGRKGRGKAPSEKQVNYLKGLAKELLGDADGSKAVEAMQAMVGDQWNSKFVSDQIAALKNKNDRDLQVALEWLRNQDAGKEPEPPQGEEPPPDEDTPEANQGGLNYGDK